jgi:hypothetical protein
MKIRVRVRVRIRVRVWVRERVRVRVRVGVRVSVRVRVRVRVRVSVGFRVGVRVRVRLTLSRIPKDSRPRGARTFNEGTECDRQVFEHEERHVVVFAIALDLHNALVRIHFAQDLPLCERGGKVGQWGCLSRAARHAQLLGSVV